MSRDMECGSVAAAAVALPIRHELQRPPLPVRDPGNGEASTRAGIPPQIELHRCIAENPAQGLSIDSRSDKAQNWSGFWYKEMVPPTVAPPARRQTEQSSPGSCLSYPNIHRNTPLSLPNLLPIPLSPISYLLSPISYFLLPTNLLSHRQLHNKRTPAPYFTL